MEQSELEQLKARVLKLEEREDVENQQLRDPAQEATPPSQRRSGMASTKLVQQPDLTGPSYPMDFITDSHQCHLMMQWQNYKDKATVGSVRPPEPGTTFHCRPIPEGYARVTVEE